MPWQGTVNDQKPANGECNPAKSGFGLPDNPKPARVDRRDQHSRITGRIAALIPRRRFAMASVAELASCSSSMGSCRAIFEERQRSRIHTSLRHRFRCAAAIQTPTERHVVARAHICRERLEWQPVAEHPALAIEVSTIFPAQSRS